MKILIILKKYSLLLANQLFVNNSFYMTSIHEDLSKYAQNLKKELAEKCFDGSAKPCSFETIKQNAWIAFLLGYAETIRTMGGSLDENNKAAVIALDSYLEKLKSVSLDSYEGESLSTKIK